MNDSSKKHSFSKGPSLGPSLGSNIGSGNPFPQNTEDSKPQDKEKQGSFIPLIGLLNRGRSIIFDSTSINSLGIQSFVNRNRKLILSSKDPLYIPSFEFQLINNLAKPLINYLRGNNAIKVIGTGSIIGYDFLLKDLALQNLERGHFCFIVNKKEKFQAILSASKAANIFVQFFSLQKNGSLINVDFRDTRPIHKDRAICSSPTKISNDSINKEQQKGFIIADKPERISVISIRAEKRFSSGDTLYDSKQNPIVLGESKIVHPSGISYSTNIPGIWAKVFNPESLNTFIREKVKRMLSRGVQFKGLCWPTDILCDRNGTFAGILIPPANGEPLQLSVFKQAKLQTFFPNWDKKDLCDLTITILRIIQYLHSKNVLLGCINPAAIRVVSKNEVYFIDTDNYQIEGFPTLIYNNSFTPPELHGRKIYLCNKANENYAVAVLVFMLMMPGKTPYTIGANKNVENTISERRFPFPNGNVHGSHAMPGMWRFMWSHLTPFKEVFYNTFQKGAKLEKPESRKDVGSWLGTVNYFKQELDNPIDPESLKIYPKTFKRGKHDEFYTCKYCGIAHPRFYFDGRYFDKFRICNSCIDKRSNVSFTCKACGKTYYYTNRMALFHANMKQQDSDWKDQKYCHDCKNKTISCKECYQEKPYYLIKNDRCPDCNEKRRNSTYQWVVCRDCGARFSVTVGEHEFAVQKGFSDPVRCKSCRNRKKNTSW